MPVSLTRVAPNLSCMPSITWFTPPDAAGVLPEGQHPGVALEHHFKIALKHLTAIEHFRVGVVHGGHRLHVQGVVVSLAVEVGVVPLNVVLLKRRQPPGEVAARRRPVSCGVDKRLPDRLRDFGAARVGVVAERFGPGGVHRLKHVAGGEALLVDRGTESRPSRLLLCPNVFFGLLPEHLQFVVCGRPLADQELGHLLDAIEFLGPREPLFRFVTLVRARGAVALRLGHLFHVHQHGHMVLPATLRGFFVGRDQ